MDEKKMNQVTSFNRSLSDDENQKFREGIHRQEWIKELLGRQKAFFALRNGYANVYLNGGSAVKLELKNGDLVCSTHYKYLLRHKVEKGSEYVQIVNGIPIWDPAKYFPETFGDADSLDGLASQSLLHAGEEKWGVHQIVLANSNVLDVEIAFPRNSPKDSDAGNKKSTDRIDFCAVRENGTNGDLSLVFYEAKHYTNKELRSRTEDVEDVEVWKQLGRYQSQLESLEKEILESYRRTCANLVDLFSESRLENAIPFMSMAKRIKDKPSSLSLVKEPKLVIFGYDGDQIKSGSIMSGHVKKLTANLDEKDEKRVLLCGDPSKFTSGISK